MFTFAVTCVYHRVSHPSAAASPAKSVAVFDMPAISLTEFDKYVAVDCKYLPKVTKQAIILFEEAKLEVEALTAMKRNNGLVIQLVKPLDWFLTYFGLSAETPKNEAMHIAKELNRALQYKQSTAANLESVNRQVAACDSGNTDVSLDDGDALTRIVSVLTQGLPKMSSEQTQEMLFSCETGAIPSESLALLFRDAFIGPIPFKGFCNQFKSMTKQVTTITRTLEFASPTTTCVIPTSTYTITQHHTVTLLAIEEPEETSSDAQHMVTVIQETTTWVTSTVTEKRTLYPTPL